ncbi:unnamed protein product [Rotaria sordida]|uniref:Uncharacterized protein n=1 Tax=Rotaria sordida TaxID=392033 RepID=A0A815RPX8_9BILA|nr:unnamed protein product [Rotaria sordida]CAF1459204.1 unnamed protein product [Rotaria sordida]CAF1477951.1 unnamed protein product [Rotaria sordida]CAF4039077.1 unnamed protein product [Rotaria sordida]CAF4084857.1 unnamed protein product [Rotaria sordida]
MCVPHSLKSTDPYDDYQDFYNNISSIDDAIFFYQKIPSNIHLSNIEHLKIKPPINNQFWSIILNWNRMKSLELSSYNDTLHSQLQVLFYCAPNLRYLLIHQDRLILPLQMSVFKYPNI